MEDGFDALVEPLGGFGKFQKKNILFLCVLSAFCALSEMTYVFTAAKLKHRCLISECETADSLYEQPWLSEFVPKTSTGDYSMCLRYNTTGPDCQVGISNETIECDVFIYETAEWTIAREDWDMHCEEDRWRLTLLGSISNLGQVIGGFFMGYLADRFGRKTVVVTVAVSVSIIGTLKSFSVTFSMMAVLELIEAIIVMPLYNESFVLAIELVRPSKRVLVGGIIAIAYPMGSIFLGTVQWLTLNWRTTLRIIYPPFFLTITYYWLMTESVRWLISKERINEALKSFEEISITNRKQFTEEMRTKVSEIRIMRNEETDKNPISVALELLKSKRMRNRLLLCLLLWMAITFTYNGLTNNSVDINDNKFLNFILTALVEIPSYVASIFILGRFGRRMSQLGTIFLCGLACLLFAFVPEENSYQWMKTILFLIGRFGSSSSYAVVGVFTAELFPTALRSTVMSWTLTAGKLASILSPQTPLLSEYYKPLPLIVFSVISFAACVIPLAFPETLGTSLPDTLEEADAMGSKKKGED